MLTYREVMTRKGTFTAIGAAAGVLVAGTVAGVAIVNAANTHPVAEPVMLVADVATQPVSAPSFSAAPLPEVLLPSAEPVSAASAASIAQPAAAPVNVTKPAITRVQARDAVLAQAPGEVLSVRLKSHQGYEAYAVKVQRADGSVVVGFADAASGVVFDWNEISGPTPTVQANDDDSDDDQSDDESSDDSKQDSHEDDHDSDDD